MLFLNHVFNPTIEQARPGKVSNTINALKYLSASHELAGDTILSNFNIV